MEIFRGGRESPRRTKRSPPPAARLPRPGQRVKLAVAEGLAGPRRLPKPPEYRGLPAPVPLATPLSWRAPRAPGRGWDGEGKLGARTSERLAEPQAGGEQDEAAGSEPPHSALAVPRPALAPGRRPRPRYLSRPLPASRRDPEPGQGAPPPTSAGAGRGRGEPLAIRSCCVPITLRVARQPRRLPELFPCSRAQAGSVGEITCPPTPACLAKELGVRAGTVEKWWLEGEAFLRYDPT